PLRDDANDSLFGSQCLVYPNAALAGLLEDAVHSERVQMNVKVQARSKSLGKPYATGRRIGYAGEHAGEPVDLFREDALQRAEHVGLRRRQTAQLEGQGQHPLPECLRSFSRLCSIMCIESSPWTHTHLLAGLSAIRNPKNVKPNLTLPGSNS